MHEISGEESSTESSTSERLTSLEIKISYLEKAMSDLDAVVREVNGQMDVLMQQVAEIRRQLFLGPPVKEMGVEDPPPHY